MNANNIRRFGQGLVLAWSAFWTWFALASGAGLNGGGLVTLFFLFNGALAWKKGKSAAVVFVAEGMALAVVYPAVFAGRLPLVTVLTTILMLPLPLIIGGLSMRCGVKRVQGKQGD